MTKLYWDAGIQIRANKVNVFCLEMNQALPGLLSQPPPAGKISGFRYFLNRLGGTEFHPAKTGKKQRQTRRSSPAGGEKPVSGKRQEGNR
jgi:hypothetical protein